MSRRIPAWEWLAAGLLWVVGGVLFYVLPLLLGWGEGPAYTTSVALSRYAGVAIFLGFGGYCFWRFDRARRQEASLLSPPRLPAG